MTPQRQKELSDRQYNLYLVAMRLLWEIDHTTDEALLAEVREQHRQAVNDIDRLGYLLKGQTQRAIY